MTLYGLEPPARLDSRTLGDRFAAAERLAAAGIEVDYDRGLAGFVRDDGGRADAGYRGTTGDCGCRAIAIALDLPYREVYDLIIDYARSERPNARRRRSHPRTGVHHSLMRRILDDYGWRWTATMTIGSGCRVHVRADELPGGRLILNLSRHYAAMIDGVVHDTHDPSRDGTRCVYGFWQPPLV